MESGQMHRVAEYLSDRQARINVKRALANLIIVVRSWGHTTTSGGDDIDEWALLFSVGLSGFHLKPNEK